MSANRTIKHVAEGWKRSGLGLCSEVVVRDCFPLPILHSERDARWCVFITFAWKDQEAYLGEYYTRVEANRAAAQYRRFLYRAYEQLSTESLQCPANNVP